MKDQEEIITQSNCRVLGWQHAQHFQGTEKRSVWLRQVDKKKGNRTQDYTFMQVMQKMLASTWSKRRTTGGVKQRGAMSYMLIGSFSLSCWEQPWGRVASGDYYRWLNSNSGLKKGSVCVDKKWSHFGLFPIKYFLFDCM
jgi:hypothetical protein